MYNDATKAVDGKVGSKAADFAILADTLTGASQQREAAEDLMTNADSYGLTTDQLNSVTAVAQSLEASSLNGSIAALEATYASANAFLTSYNAEIASFSANQNAIEATGSAAISAAYQSLAAAATGFSDPAGFAPAASYAAKDVKKVSVPLATAADFLSSSKGVVAGAASAGLPKTGEASNAGLFFVGAVLLSSSLSLAGVEIRRRHN